MVSATEVRTLFHDRKKPILLLALLTLLIAQGAAGLHALKHFGNQADPLSLPGHPAQLCLECASFAPLNTVHSGGVTAFIVAAHGAYLCIGAAASAPARCPVHLPFRSRAPPR
jgi:hypothetical protein